MKRIIGLLVVAAALTAATAAMATPPPQEWFFHGTNGGGQAVCNQDANNPLDGPYASKSACENDNNASIGEVCVTSLDGLQGHDDITNIVGDATLPASFEFSKGQEKQIVPDFGYDGPCNADGGAGIIPPPPAGIFLCYSTFQTTPGVWPADVAPGLLKQGYWQAYAIKGNVAGGTNVGGFHLVCNVAAGQALGLQFSDEGGSASNGADHSAIAGALGWYTVISG